MLLFQLVGVDKRSFVPEKMFTIEIILRKRLPRLILQHPLIPRLNPIPNLLIPFMQIVNSRQIQILLMPAENRLPRPHITIRIGDTFYKHRRCVSQQRIKITEIPATCLRRHEGFVQVGAVDGWGVFDCFPKL